MLYIGTYVILNPITYANQKFVVILAATKAYIIECLFNEQTMLHNWQLPLFIYFAVI